MCSSIQSRVGKMEAKACCSSTCRRRVKLSFTRYSTSERIAKKTLLSFSAESGNFQNSDSCVQDYIFIVLPPANEVWRKVIFSQVLFCRGGGGVCMMSLPALSHDPSKRVSVWGNLCSGGSLSRGGLCRETP